MRSLSIDLLSIRSHHVGSDVTHNVERAVVVVHGILKVLRGIVVLVLIFETTFLELNDAFHELMLHVELNLGIVSIYISHFLVSFLFTVFLVILDELRQHLLDSTRDDVVGNLVDWRIRVGVDRDDDARFLHTGDVLDST